MMHDSQDNNDSHLLTCGLLLFAGMMFVFQSFVHAKDLEEIRSKNTECQTKIETMERTLLLNR